MILPGGVGSTVLNVRYYSRMEPRSGSQRKDDVKERNLLKIARC
jgi:hypothetical protein